MAHFVQLDENNIVIWGTPIDNALITDENGEEQESLGIQHIHNTIPGSENYTWKQTSYNSNFRGRYAGLGYIYNESLDVFIRPKPFDSWLLDTDTKDWVAPVPRPESTVTDSEITNYHWNEETLSWDEEVIPKPYPSWITNPPTPGENYLWISPISPPTEVLPSGYQYEWDEETVNWIIVKTQ